MKAMGGKKPPRDWKYIQIISGNDVPIKTNLEMVQILQIYNGSQDVELSPGHRGRYSHVVQIKDANQVKFTVTFEIFTTLP